MNSILFADSGGTGTDWVYLDTSGKKKTFKTESYHPVNWTDSFWKTVEEFWNSKPFLLEYSIHFFGAGCLNENNCKLLKHKFESFGFNDVRVQSDLHAAGYASVKNGNGAVIISGTGSVLFDFSNEEVSNVIGGKGHLLGDEGSGFYFGKLIIEAYKKSSLSAKQLSILNERVHLSSMSKLEQAEAKIKWASLSKELQDFNSVFENLHEENVSRFIKTHFNKATPVSVSLIGSYAYHNQKLWKKLLASAGCKVEGVIKNPIDHLIE